MERLDNIATLKGRKIVREAFKELRFEKQHSAFYSLMKTWRLCTTEKELSKITNKNIVINNPLGIFSGTGVWLEEIVNRFYYSTINSFVYFGAAILLVIIGVRRFNENVSNDIVIAGILFEAALLLFMFLVMLFSPSDETDDEQPQEESEELLLEIGEISRDFAAVVLHLEKISDNLSNIFEKQSLMIDKIDGLNDKTSLLIQPNNEMMETMKETNQSLVEFKNTVDNLVNSTHKLTKEEIEHSVKAELSKYFSNIINEK